MSSFVIACPNPVCGRPLNLPAAAVGQPLACPHCGIGIGVTLGPDGQPLPPTAIPTARRVPKQFLVPGFALLLFGAAGVFGNGYFALTPGKDRELAAIMVRYARDGEQATKPADANRGKADADPREAFAAVMGQGARVATDEEADRIRAEQGGGWIGPACGALAGVSLLMAAGGVAMLMGRWYWLAMVGCVAAFVNLNPCFCVPGGVAGLWGILMLARDDGRRHFGKL